MNLVIYLGPLLLLLGFLGAVISFAFLHASPSKPQALRLALLSVGASLVGFIIGAWLGAEYFCSSADAGNLCGLGGIFGTGPAAAGFLLSIGAAIMLRARNPRSAP